MGHIFSCSTFNGHTDNLVTMKDIHVRRLTGLDMVGNNVRGNQSGLRTGWIKIKVTVVVLFIVRDADDLSRLYHEVPVIIREEGTLTEEVVCVRATGLLAQGTDLVLMGLSGVRLRVTPATRTGVTKIIIYHRT